MVQHRRGRGLMLLGAGLSCAGGLGLAALGVWEADQPAVQHSVHPPGVLLACYAIIACGAALSLWEGTRGKQRGLRSSSMAMSGGLLLAVGFLALSAFTSGWLKAVLILGAGASILFGAAANWRQWRGGRA